MNPFYLIGGLILAYVVVSMLSKSGLLTVDNTPKPSPVPGPAPHPAPGPDPAPDDADTPVERAYKEVIEAYKVEISDAVADYGVTVASFDEARTLMAKCESETAKMLDSLKPEPKVLVKEEVVIKDEPAPPPPKDDSKDSKDTKTDAES